MELKIQSKFQIGDKVYTPRIDKRNKRLIDIRPYYVTRINVSFMSYKSKIEYHISKYKDVDKGILFHDDGLLFHSFDEAMEYVEYIRNLGMIE